MSTANTWDFEGYWSTVIGDCRTPESAVREYGFTDLASIRAWLAEAEAEALRVGGQCRPASWDAHNARAEIKLFAVVA